jgi:hypothetical protein
LSYKNGKDILKRCSKFFKVFVVFWLHSKTLHFASDNVNFGWYKKSFPEFGEAKKTKNKSK